MTAIGVGAGVTHPLSDHSPLTLLSVHLPAESDGAYTMTDGPWMRRRDGRFSSAALGGFLEHALGGGTARGVIAPEGAIDTVATEISFQMVPGVDARGDIHCRTSVVGVGRVTATGRGVVTDASGRTIAYGSANIQYIPRVPRTAERADPSLSEVRPGGPALAAEVESLDDILDLDLVRTPDGAMGAAQPGPWLRNYMDALHGSFVIAMLERTAEESVGGDGWALASFRVHFLRPASLAGPLTVRAQPAHTGRTFAAVSARMIRDDGKPAAIATASYRR